METSTIELVGEGVTPTRLTILFDLLSPDVLLCRGAMPFLEHLAAEVEKRRGLLSQSAIVGPDGAEYFNEKMRSSRRLSLADSSVLPPEVARFVPLVRAVEGLCLARYVELVNPHAVVEGGMGHELLRYGDGQAFGLHVDAVRAHPILSQRRLSGIGFCSEGHEGGFLSFPRQDLELKLKVGDFVLFPSGFTHPHEVTAVRGTTPRWSLVTWYF